MTDFPAVEFFESDFPLAARAYGAPRSDMLDMRWVMIHLGLDRQLIIDYLRCPEPERKFYVSLIRNVVPGFMNQSMRRAQAATFNRALAAIWNSGCVPVYEITIDQARRLSDFSSS